MRPIDDVVVYLELVRCMVEEGVEGVSLAAHPHVVVERGQLLCDHSVGEHLAKTDMQRLQQSKTCVQLTPSRFVTITTSTTTFSGSRIGALKGGEP